MSSEPRFHFHETPVSAILGTGHYLWRGGTEEKCFS
jgi:hypothetical protein